MNIELNQNGLCLKRNQVLKMRGGLGHSVVCHSGSVWVTQDADPRDTVLSAGDSFTLDRDGLAIVLAFEPSTISIAQAEPQSRGPGLAAFVKAVLSFAGPARGVART